MAVKASYKVTLIRVNDGAKGDKGDTGAKGADGQMLLATCSTDGATAAKVATLASGSISLKAGTSVAVKFTSANSADTPTLNVGGTGAKQIRAYVNAALTADYYWSDSATVTFVYDGTYWLISDPDALRKAKDYADSVAQAAAENAQAAAEKTAEGYRDDAVKTSQTYTDSQINGVKTDISKDISDVRSLAQEAADADATTRSMLSDYQTQVGQWLSFDGTNGVTIGASGSKYSTQITNDRMAYLYGGQAVAYTSGKQFYVPEIVVTGRLILGNYIFIVGSNGNVVIMKKDS